MGLIEICNRLEDFIIDIHGTKDYNNMKRQMELKNVTLNTGEQKEVIMLKKGGGAYEANAAFFKIKADAAVDSDGNVYIPFSKDNGGEAQYTFVRKLKREDALAMIREIIYKLREGTEGKEYRRSEGPRLVM